MPEVPATNHPPETAVTGQERAAQELLERLRAATLGEYDVHGELGRGGMAIVYLAHEISLDRKVAIKVMLPSMVHGSGMVERFKREARTAAALSHPNIIPIYSVREVDGLLFCVIKLVKGTPLDGIMKEIGQLPVPMVQGILAQVGGALGYAHRHGVIHRDIKPGNILIDDEGWAVVTDFGIAKVQENEGLTVTGMAVGTPAYMSPEQASADAITGASDQYSLGIVAYEMLAGRTPFTGASMMALMYSHFHDEPPSLRLLRPDIPDQLHDAVMRMLRKSAAERWPSMEDAVAAAGARPLAPDDPTRSQLISLAKTGLTHRIVSQATTPRSPIPAKPRGKAAAASRATRNPLVMLTVGAGLAGAGFLVAKLMAGPAAPTTIPEQNGPAPFATVSAESVTLAPESRSEPRQAGASLLTPPIAPTGQSRVGGQRPVAGRVDSSPPVTSAPAPEQRAEVVVQRPESSGTPPAQKAESTVSAPVPAPPPVTTSAPPPQAPVTVTRTPDPSGDITTIIQSYARALAASDLATARRIYPGMPNDQREGLEALWREGGSMTPTWTISDIAVDGTVATARVRGSNVVTTRRGQSSTVPVAFRARLERRGVEWRLVALVN